MRIGRCVLQQKLCVLLQRASSIVEIMYLHLYAFRIAERHEFLLDGIP